MGITERNNNNNNNNERMEKRKTKERENRFVAFYMGAFRVRFLFIVSVFRFIQLNKFIFMLSKLDEHSTRKD